MKLVRVFAPVRVRAAYLTDSEVKDHPLWVHVDAAWAGVLLSCPEYREQLQLDRINEYADSFCTNFHKVPLVFASLLYQAYNRIKVGSGQL